MFRLVLLFATLMLVACSPTSITFSLGAPSATPTATLTPLPSATLTSTPDFTATAQVQASATAQAQATANAQATATANAQATVTANAQATATAQARTSATAAAATAQANATAAAQAAAAATKNALLAYVDALVAKAGRPLRETQGDLSASKWYTVEGSWKNFVLDVQFSNPADPAIHPWDFGFRFRMGAPTERYWGLYVFSDRTWMLRRPQKALADQIQMIDAASGRAETMDVSPTGSNKVRLVVYENSGFLYLNGEFVTMLDLSAIPTDGALRMGTGFLLRDDFPGLSVTFKNLSVAGLP